jgi:hypothetical protein
MDSDIVQKVREIVIELSARGTRSGPIRSDRILFCFSMKSRNLSRQLASDFPRRRASF